MLESNKKKDRWDKFDIFVKFLGVVLVGLIGTYFTYDYHSKQTEIFRLEVMERFIPHIADSPKRREVALVTLAQLGYEKEALGFENLYDDEETKSAITVIRAGTFKTKDSIEGASAVPKGKINAKE